MHEELTGRNDDNQDDGAIKIISFVMTDTPEHRLHRQSLALALKQLLYGVNTAIDPRSNHHEYKPKLHLQRHR